MATGSPREKAYHVMLAIFKMSEDGMSVDEIAAQLFPRSVDKTPVAVVSIIINQFNWLKKACADMPPRPYADRWTDQ